MKADQEVRIVPVRVLPDRPGRRVAVTLPKPVVKHLNLDEGIDPGAWGTRITFDI